MSNKQGFTLWFTGLPCSGKTTLADLAADELRKRGVPVERLDGDIVRKGLTRDLGFSKEDRQKNIERITFVSKLLSRNNVGVLASFISPYRGVRDNVRKEVTNFVEVFVNCPVEVCEKRDVKGMFKKARRGEITNFTGVDDPYETPTDPEITLRTDLETPDECVRKILEKLENMKFIAKRSEKREYSEGEKKEILDRLISLGHVDER